MEFPRALEKAAGAFAVAATAWVGFLAAVPAAADTIVVGGSGQAAWDTGDGRIEPEVGIALPTAIASAGDEFSVIHTNTPGGVVDFASRPGWIFPQRADTTRNILIGLTGVTRGGSISSRQPSTQTRFEDHWVKMIDDDPETALEVRAPGGGGDPNADGLLFDFDLNALFAINRIRFFPRNAAADYPAPGFPFQNDFLKGYEISINDGRPESFLANGDPIWTPIAQQPQNQERVVDIRLAPRFVRRMRLETISPAEFEIAEFQVFSEGFVPQAVYLSSVYDFGEPALLGRLRWTEETIGEPGLSSIEIRTRTGVDPDPVEYTRKGAQLVFVEKGGGVSGARTRLTPVPVEVPWKRPADVEDDSLRELIETELDDDLLTGPEAELRWSQMPIELRGQIALTGEDYDRIGDSKSEIRDDLGNWSGWSPRYPAAGSVSAGEVERADLGVEIFSPSPRRYFQFRVEFSTGSFEAATGLAALAFDLSRPALASGLIGEIAPRTAQGGETTSFTYAVLARLDGQTPGLDQLDIRTPVRVQAVGRVEVRNPDGAGASADFAGVDLSQLAAGTAPITQGDFSIEQVRERGFRVGFPPVERDSTLVAVRFDAAVLRPGTVFEGQGYNTGVGSLGQRVTPGNAADLGGGEAFDPDRVQVGIPEAANLTVHVPISGEPLVNVAADPAAFTPNGDRVNDGTLIRYDVTNIAAPTGVEVLLFDLAGRRVRTLYERSDSGGRFAVPWTGEDDAGRMVPPGSYLFRVSLDTDSGEVAKVGLVSVAY